MKKLLCAVLVVVMVLSLAACGTTLKGTYKSEEKFGADVTYTFDGDKVMRSLSLMAKAKTLVMHPPAP